MAIIIIPTFRVVMRTRCDKAGGANTPGILCGSVKFCVGVSVWECQVLSDLRQVT